MAVDLSFYKSPLSQELREAGREAGREEGRAERAALDILKVLAKRGIEVSEEVQERITHCDDLETLDRWLLEAVVAPTAEAIFTDDEV
ncbi:MAG: hypothetical protein H5T76_13515 [Streptomyces sp.]|nr:hypothetical protein [Streptomyces sp.]